MKKWLALAVLLVAALGAWQRPITLWRWANRAALSAVGLAKQSVPTSVGVQTIFAGGGGQPLFLIHGAGDNAGTWSKTARALLATGRYRVIAIDMAGHGDSEPATGPLPMDALFSAMSEIVQRESHGARVVLMGNSMGGWISLLYARAHPDRVERVVSVCGGTLRGIRPGVTLLPANRGEAREMFASMLDASTPSPPGFVLDDQIRRARTGSLGRMAASMASFTPYLIEDHLADIQVPVDLVWGASDRLLPLDYGRTFERGLPAVRMSVIPGCGHCPQQECAAAFLNVVLKLLASPPPSGKEPVK